MDNTANLVAKLNYRMQSFIVDNLEEQGIHGIVPSHGAIVLSLVKNKTLTMNELAKKIDKDPSTVTCLVKKLTNIGYTVINKDESDKRSILVSLTPKGHQLVDSIIDISSNLYQQQFVNFQESEIITFRTLLEKMMQNFD